MTNPFIVETYRKALYRARIDADRMKLDLVRAQLTVRALEDENEALREMVSTLALSAGGGARL